MISSCIVELMSGGKVVARHLCSNAQSAVAISDSALDRKVADETMVFWMQAENQADAISGAFVSRSTAFSYPGNKIIKAPEQFGGYRCTDELTRRRAAYALEAGTDGARQERSIEPVFIASEHIAPPFDDIPLEDRLWAKSEIEARVSGKAPPRHPNSEIDFIMELSHRTGTL